MSVFTNGHKAPDSGPELRLRATRARGSFWSGTAGQCKLIMINNEALVQTKSLFTQLSLTTNQRNPGCLVIAGNTGNVVCNTSFTDLSDSRVKTEIAEADVAELLQRISSNVNLCQRKPLFPFFGTPCFLFFCFFLSPAKVGSLEMQPGANCKHI